MQKVRLGRTGLMVTKTSFGALPIQRISFDETRAILRKAYESGINFFDTARSYSNSEEKIGYSLADVRKDIYLATKSPSKDKEGVLRDIQTSLQLLKTDYVDILQLHNPSQLPDPEDPDGMYAGLLEAQKRGYCRFIGITNHRLELAVEAAKSGKYDTVQYPFNYLSTPAEEDLVRLCAQEDVGFIVMKAMSGGLITDASVTFAHLRQFENAVPIYGIQRMEELEQFLSLEENPPVLDEKMMAVIAKDRKELAGNFCRGCGYCMPCPAGIDIPTAARMSLLLRRSPYQNWLKDEQYKAMQRIEDCKHCNQCSAKCPYQLDTPALLRANWEDYQQFYREHQPK
ncbi:MAG: aldo/keto reductase [Candidatus Merdivicinus sp.]|jgi:aryl-alcohol dehydrogenase-like predicted oxidoreductase